MSSFDPITKAVQENRQNQYPSEWRSLRVGDAEMVTLKDGREAIVTVMKAIPTDGYRLCLFAVPNPDSTPVAKDGYFLFMGSIPLNSPLSELSSHPSILVGTQSLAYSQAGNPELRGGGLCLAHMSTRTRQKSSPGKAPMFSMGRVNVQIEDLNRNVPAGNPTGTGFDAFTKKAATNGTSPPNGNGHHEEGEGSPSSSKENSDGEEELKKLMESGKNIPF